MVYNSHGGWQCLVAEALWHTLDVLIFEFVGKEADSSYTKLQTDESIYRSLWIVSFSFSSDWILFYFE